MKELYLTHQEMIDFFKDIAIDVVKDEKNIYFALRYEPKKFTYTDPEWFIKDKYTEMEVFNYLYNFELVLQRAHKDGIL
jgi:hypothetical protein